MKRKLSAFLALVILLGSCSEISTGVTPARELSPTPNLAVAIPVLFSLTPKKTKKNPSSARKNDRISERPFVNTQIAVNWMDSLKSAVRQPEVYFRVKAQSDTILIAPHGTSIIYAANSFLLPDNTPATGWVDFSIRECYDGLSFFANDLTTWTTNNRILETGGSVFLEAKQDSIALRLDPLKPLQVGFPIPESQLERPVQMQAFYQDTNETNFVRWQDNTRRAGDRFSMTSNVPKDSIIRKTYIHMDSAHSELANLKLIDGSGTLRSWMIDRQIRTKELSEWAGTAGAVNVWVSFHPNGKIREIKSTKLVHQERLDALYSWLKTAPVVDMRQIEAKAFYEIRLVGKPMQSNVTLEAYLKEQTDENGRLNPSVASAILGRYMLTANNLGWINCDRYPASSTERVAVTLEREAGTSYYLLVKNYQAMLQPIETFGYVIFNDVPKNESVRLVAVKNGEEGLFAGSKDLTIKGRTVTKLEAAEPTAVVDLKKLLEL
ncbi:MAG: hypothetical protein ACOVO3_01540 [Fluviicola sp.]